MVHTVVNKLECILIVGSMRTDIDNRKEEIIQWIEEERSKAFICLHLGCRQDTLNRRLRKWGVEYKGNQGNKGHKQSPYKLTIEEYLSKNPATRKSYIVCVRLVEEGYKVHKCEECEGTTWCGEAIPLELNHIDGNRYNWNLDNLELLCPNCHAQTDTYRGKNIGSYN